MFNIFYLFISINNFKIKIKIYLFYIHYIYKLIIKLLVNIKLVKTLN